MIRIDDDRTERLIWEYLAELDDLERRYAEAKTDRWRTTIYGKIKTTSAKIGRLIYTARDENKMKMIYEEWRRPR